MKIKKCLCVFMASIMLLSAPVQSYATGLEVVIGVLTLKEVIAIMLATVGVGVAVSDSTDNLSIALEDFMSWCNTSGTIGAGKGINIDNLPLELGADWKRGVIKPSDAVWNALTGYARDKIYSQFGTNKDYYYLDNGLIYSVPAGTHEFVFNTQYNMVLTVDTASRIGIGFFQNGNSFSFFAYSDAPINGTLCFSYSGNKYYAVDYPNYNDVGLYGMHFSGINASFRNILTSPIEVYGMTFTSLMERAASGMFVFPDLTIELETDSIYTPLTDAISTLEGTLDLINNTGDRTLTVNDVNSYADAVSGAITWDTYLSGLGVNAVDVADTVAGVAVTDRVVGGTVAVDGVQTGVGTITDSNVAVQDVLVPTISGSGEFMADLTQVFPFCVPFDLIYAIKVLAAEPETPHFNIPIELHLFGFNLSYDIDIDFSFLDQVAYWIRIMETLGFIIILIVITRKIVKG